MKKVLEVMDADNKSTFGTFTAGAENPFSAKDKTLFGNLAGGGENPFFSVPVPVTGSSGNVFGNTHCNEVLSNIQLPSNMPVFGTATITSQSQVKNPFFSNLNVPGNPMTFAAPTTTTVETFKSNSNLPGDQEKEMDNFSTVTTLPNPFFVQKCNNGTSLFSESAQPLALGGDKKCNPFMPKQKDQGSNAPILSLTFGTKGRNSPSFTHVALVGSKNNPKIDSMGPIPGSISKSVRSSLDELKPSLSLLADNLKSVICMNSESKYDVLDKIDKTIRKGVKLSFYIQDGKRYRALRGTCLDMCLEKERYFRDDKHQISPFELTMVQDIVSNHDGDYPQLDHRKAVKEYSRSSADQEEPLPHQLRPAPVLSLTMEYLVSNIMDIRYSKRNDWFDFLWNRTRAIRKDITQQNLSCMATILIIEKCARFHIFSSHYLCEQELHVFEPKMNLENLTKCLQTLKHMYEDNEKKDNGEICFNEAEFRCYQILLNLNDNDMLREAMHFRKDIRESTPVKFALKVFSAVHQNNYVRFFKLLKSASFLNSCLLQPYFNQIRGSALSRMLRIFSQPNTDVPYSLKTLQDILAFDNIPQATDFCQQYGLVTQDLYVYFNRSSLSKPEDAFQVHQSVVVAEKLKSSMSEIVNNGLLKSSEEAYVPTNSFSDAGVYIGNYHMLDNDTFNETAIKEAKCEVLTVEGMENQAGNFSPSPVFETQVVGNVPELVNNVLQVVKDDIEIAVVEPDVIDINDSSDSVINSEDLREVHSQGDDPDYVLSEDGDYGGDEYNEYSEGEDVMFLREDFIVYIDELISEEIEKCFSSIFPEVVVDVKNELIQQSEAMTNQELAFICIEETRQAVSEVIGEEQVKRIKEKEEMRQMIESEAMEFSNSTIEETVIVVVKSISAEAYQDEMDILAAEVLKHEINTQTDTVLNMTLNEEVSKICSGVITEAYSNRTELLQTNKQTILKKKLSSMFNRWIKAYKQQQFIKSSLIDFPPLPPLITIKEAVHKLHPDGDISYSLPNLPESKAVTKPKRNDCVFQDISSYDISKEEQPSKCLSSIIEDGISLLFFKDFYKHCLYCESLLLPIAKPNDIIEFYNNVLAAIKNKIMTNITVMLLREKLDKVIQALELPAIIEADPYDWESSCFECGNFINKVTDSGSSVLLSRVNSILDRYISRASEGEDILFPWSEILEVCIFNKLSSMYLQNFDVDSIIPALVGYDSEIISAIHVVNPLREHIRKKRIESFASQNSFSYKREMERKKFSHEHKLRKSLDSIDSELEKIQASLLRKNKLPMRERSSSLQDLLDQSAAFLGDVGSEKENHLHSRSFSPSNLDVVTVISENKHSPKISSLKRQSGCKRTFEYSMMEYFKDIDDYRTKLKTREDYWRDIIDQ